MSRIVVFTTKVLLMALCYDLIEMRIRMIKDVVSKNRKVKDVAKIM